MQLIQPMQAGRGQQGANINNHQGKGNQQKPSWKNLDLENKRMYDENHTDVASAFT